MVEEAVVCIAIQYETNPSDPYRQVCQCLDQGLDLSIWAIASHPKAVLAIINNSISGDLRGRQLLSSSSATELTRLSRIILVYLSANSLQFCN
jgi:hypothetical protein